MKAFRLLALRRLRHQPLRAAVATVAVAAGVALAVSVLVTTSSIDGSLVEQGRALAGPAPLRIVGASNHGGLTLEAVEAAAGVDGVRTVVPMVQAIARADRAGESRRVLVLGIDCQAEALFGRFGCDPNALAAAGDAPVARGPGLTGRWSLRTDTGRIDLDDVAVVDELPAIAGGQVVVLSLDGARERFARPLGVDVAYVVPEEGVDLAALRERVHAAVGPHNGVLTRNDPPPVVRAALSAFLPLFTLLGLFGLGTGAILVRNTVTLALEERRRQLAILGALGASGRTVVGGAVAEAALLGGVGGALGTVAGIGLAGPIVASLSNFTTSVVGMPLSRHVTTGSIVTGVVLGTAVGGLAAVGSARRALRQDVAAELSGRRGIADAQPPRLRRRLVIAGTLLALGLAGCVVARSDGALEPWQAGLAPVAFLVASISSLVFGGALAPLLLRRLAAATRRTRRGTVLLGFANLVRDPRRSGILVVAIASPVIVGFVTDGFVQSVRTGITDTFAENGDFVSVSTIDPNDGNDGFLPEPLLEAIAALPESGAVHRGSFLVTGSRANDLIGIDAVDEPDRYDVIDGRVDLDRFRAGDVLIGPALARRTGARAGDHVEVATPTGFVSLRVLAVVADGDFGGRSVYLSPERLAELYGRVPPAFVAVEPAPGVTEEQLAIAIDRSVGTLEPALRVRSSAAIAAEVADSVEDQMVPFRVLQQGLLLVAFVAVLSNLLLVGIQRQREIGLLAAVGADPAQLRRVVVTEAATVGGVAVAQSGLIGPLMLWATIVIIPVIVGFRDPFDPAWTSLLVGGGIAVLVAVVASLWPAWRAGRVEVLEALRYE